MNRPYSKLLGLAQDPVNERKHIWELHPVPTEQARLQSIVRELSTKKPDPYPIITTLKRDDGSDLPIRIDWNYLYSRAGKLVGYVGLAFLN